jgi:hypothetical protein
MIYKTMINLKNILTKKTNKFDYQNVNNKFTQQSFDDEIEVDNVDNKKNTHIVIEIAYNQ